MNGKKIALLTTLIATLVLVIFVIGFARFVLNIDTGMIGATIISKEEKQPSDADSPKDGENQPEDETGNQSAQKPSDEKTEADNKEDEKEKDKDNEKDKDEKEQETEIFKAASKIKTAAITVEQEKDGKLTVEDEEKLTKLLEELEALKLTEVQQSVGMQDAKWKASLNLSMADATAVSVKLYESTLSGSQAILSTGSKTYESTEKLDSIKKLLTDWLEEERKANAPEIAAAEFEQANHLLTINPFSMEVQDASASKASIQAAMGELQVLETLSGNINPGVEYTGTNMIDLVDDDGTLVTLEFYETGILVYRSNGNEFYVCEKESLKKFYQTVEQVGAKYSSIPAELALMNRDAFNSAAVSSTTGTSRKEVGLVREHAENLFGFLQQLHVKKGSMREETKMFSRPEYHADLEFRDGTVIGIDISKGSLLIDSNGTISRYTLIGDSNLELVRAEFERVTSRT